MAAQGPGDWVGLILKAVAAAGIEVLLLRFGAFELDLKKNELRRGGVLLKLAPQQFRVLRMLAEHSGDVCTREEIQREIWGNEVFVDFDRSLNVCVAQIRSVLNDDSDAPRFIQTVPRRGYRFVAPVEQVAETVVEARVAQPAPLPAKRRALAFCVMGLTCAAAAFYLWIAGASAHRTMLAVLSFENVTRRAEDAPAIDGLTDELITEFGSILPERLGVIGRTSVLRLAGRNASLPEIGRELGVDYVIEGDVRGEGGRVRIGVRLVKVADQSQVWSETYERDEANRLEMQEEIAAMVSTAVVRSLFPRGASPSVRAHVPGHEAYEAFTNGRYLQHKNQRAESERAIGWFQEAGNRDPAYDEPWAAMAETYASQALSGAAPAAEALEKARAAAQHALRLNSANAEAHNALAKVLFWRDWNWKEAQVHFVKALAINPSLAQAHHDYAFDLIAMGHTEAGLASLRRGIALDPLSPRVNADAGWVLLQAHHFDEAIAQEKRALELEPHLGEATACIARAEQFLGKASRETMEFYRSVLERGERTGFYNRALADAVLGRDEEAMRALQTAFEQREIQMPLAKTEPALTGLHKDARFRELMRKMSLE
jgi:TolB-like protein/DNA-binding winged helix-turn-helix (wHTH) protein